NERRAWNRRRRALKASAQVIQLDLAKVFWPGPIMVEIQHLEREPLGRLQVCVPLLCFGHERSKVQNGRKWLRRPRVQPERWLLIEVPGTDTTGDEDTGQAVSLRGGAFRSTGRSDPPRPPCTCRQTL